MCQFITGRKCRCARRAHYDSLRAAAKRRLLACTLAAAREEGALRPLLRITPAGGCSRVPATANKFVHMLWKNLICDNVAAAQFCARPRGRGCWRCEACAHRFHKGDAPAECCAGAQCAPLRVTDAVFSALGSWPRMARRGRRALRGGSSERYAHRFGVAANPLPVAMANGRQPEGVTYFCAQRALKEGVVIRKRQGEPWFPLLLCACRAQRHRSRRPQAAKSPARDARAHTTLRRGVVPRARNARPYGV